MTASGMINRMAERLLRLGCGPRSASPATASSAVPARSLPLPSPSLTHSLTHSLSISHSLSPPPPPPPSHRRTRAIRPSDSPTRCSPAALTLSRGTPRLSRGTNSREILSRERNERESFQVPAVTRRDAETTGDTARPAAGHESARAGPAVAGSKEHGRRSRTDCAPRCSHAQHALLQLPLSLSLTRSASCRAPPCRAARQRRPRPRAAPPRRRPPALRAEHTRTAPGPRSESPLGAVSYREGEGAGEGTGRERAAEKARSLRPKPAPGAAARPCRE